MLARPTFSKCSGYAFVLAAAVAGAFPAGAAEQAFPTKPIRVIVTTPAGSGADFFARVVAQGLTETYKQQVVVENRPGAGGLIGAGAIAQSPSDGYTMGVASTSHVVAPVLQVKPPYRPIEDFTPIALLTAIPGVVVASATLPVKSVQDLIALAKSKPGQLNFASLGDGTAAHLQAEIFNRGAGIKVTHVPFKSVGDSHTAIISGDVHYLVYVVPSAMPLVKGGKARALAVTGPKRSSALPDVPTVAESGVPAAESETLMGLVGPAKMPRDLVVKLHRDISTVLRSADARERFATQGGIPAPDVTAEQYGTMLKREYETYGKLIRELGLKPR
jgi:tripartite-type tricarboxylate transporter receptor subunit TctC